MTTGIDRRDFLKLGLAGLATTAVGVGMSGRIPLPMAGQAEATTATTARSAARSGHGDSETSPYKWAMVIDQSKCIGCDLCLAACHAYNDTPPDISWSRVDEIAPTADGRRVFRPTPCMHCEDAPCVEICPVSATYRRADGIIMMDYDKCIGCRYCQLSCPYGARYFNWQAFTGPNPDVPAAGHPEVERRPRGVVEKCSFCVQRIDRGLATGLKPGIDPDATPACVVACTYGARLFGDLNDPDSPVSIALRNHPEAYRLKEKLGTEPRVYYLPAEGQQVSSEEEGVS